ncbi:unnamed protein product [Blepharisma stoltei]|uniref:cGMP-dependent protein kinase n=1 Tax=Blepharisma stoltei TaxID=1481888 RepID=A0AAU9JIU5_9CILI|nr:unnamed protein product [Blepharisma stoltei]
MGVCMSIAKPSIHSVDSRSLLSTVLVQEEQKISLNTFENSGARKLFKKKGSAFDSRLEEEITLDAPTAVVTDKDKTRREVDNIKYALSKHFIFNSLTEDQLDFIIGKMKHYALSPDAIVFMQDQPGGNFFVVASGKLQVIINGTLTKILKPGDSFGELALLHDTPRSATIKTIEKTVLWGVDRQTFRTTLEQLNSMNYQENLNFIETVPIFQILTVQQRDALVSSLSTHAFYPQQRIVNEGEPGDLFYLIKEGTVSCVKEGQEIRSMGRGDYFGEQALLHNCVRTATVIAITQVKCLAIGRDSLTKVLGSKLQHIIYINTQRIALERSPYISQLTRDQVESIIRSMRVHTFQHGQIVINAGIEKGVALYILLKGNLRNHSGTKVYESLCCLGDLDITGNFNEIYPEELIAEGKVDIAVISRAEFEILIGGEFIEIINKNEALAVLKKVQIFRDLSQDKIIRLMNCLKLEEFQDGDFIFKQNDPGDSLFIIKTGRVEVIKNHIRVRTVAKHDYFGERSVLYNDLRTASIKASGQVTCWVLHQKDFLNIINDDIKNLLVKRIQLQDTNVNLQDLIIKKTLGRGMFGIVFLVMHKSKKTCYALKTVERKKVLRYQIQNNLVLERKVLMQLDHIMIMKLIRTFKDEKRIYFLTEYVRGQELFDVIRQMGLLSESDAKFYISCLVVILEHLHERDIVYRDLKPENIMVDDDGYPKLIDFGVAKILQGRTFTIVGTPHYMAPEIITGKGYGTPVDYWSMGIILYEFICGSVPFGEDEEDPFAIYQKILDHNLMFPSWLDQSLPARVFVEQLLHLNPSLRNGGSIQKLKTNSWFSTVLWENLLSKQVKPPLIPLIVETESAQSGLLHFNLDDYISKEEANSAFPSITPKQRPGSNLNWDEDF